MNISLKCFGDLSKRYDCGYETETSIDARDGTTAAGIARDLGIPASDVKIVFVNGKITDGNQTLGDGDRIALAPATGGM